MTVFVDQFDDFRPKRHARTIQFLPRWSGLRYMRICWTLEPEFLHYRQGFPRKCLWHGAWSTTCQHWQPERIRLLPALLLLQVRPQLPLAMVPGRFDQARRRHSSNKNTNHIVDGKYSGPTLQLAAPPILVAAIDNLDDVTLFKRKFPWLSGFKGIQCPDTSDYEGRRRWRTGD